MRAVSAHALRRAIEVNTTHGMSGTREYGAWKHARARCVNPQHAAFKHYGGRGNSMCKGWANSFGRFLADMGYCPANLTLDRIDPNEGYEPTNCRWTDMRTQLRNKRSNVWIEIDGRKQLMIDWCRETGVKHYNAVKKLQRWRSPKEIFFGVK